jgi:hypothetical protein
MDWHFLCNLQKALQTRDEASVAAAEALQEASAAESVLQLNLHNYPISTQAQIISF